jgi:ribulose-phosphate 3-epimerase
MRQAVDIIPAILAYSYKELAEHCGRLKGIAPRVQIDVVDGAYASPKSWPHRDGAQFKQIVKDERGLPRWGELDFEFDLMVEDPAAEAMEYVHAGASRILLHAKSPTAPKALEMLLGLRDSDDGAFSVKVGVALGAGQSPDHLEPFEAQFDFVQVMGIDKEGRQGQSFDEKARYLVERLHHRYPALPIQVDGGVSIENARALATAGATRLVVGSALWKQDDLKAAYEALYNEANAQ